MGYNFPMPRAIFFIPSYYDSKSFLRLRSEILSQWKNWEAPKFYLLDDTCGKDPGLSGARNIADTIIISFERHLGHQRLLVKGIRGYCELNPESVGDLLISMDGDGEDRAQDAIRMIDEWTRHNDRDPVILAKRQPQEVATAYGLSRQIYKTLFYFLTGLKLETGNFALFSLARAREIICSPDFEYSYASSLVKHGRPQLLLPCKRGVRWEGKTKMGPIAWLNHGYFFLLPHRDKIIERLSFIK